MGIKWIYLLIFLALNAAAAPIIRTESDLYSVYAQGEMEFDTYWSLRELMDDKPLLCDALDHLSLVPGITPEDLDALERSCNAGGGPVNPLSADLLEKVAPFVSVEQGMARLTGEYRFSRDLEDTNALLQKKHCFNIRYSQDDISASSQGRSDDFGAGYFYRNNLEIKEKGMVHRLALGSFRERIGLNLTFGGVARTAGDANEPASFAETFVSPAAREPFGAYLALNSGRFTPFALISMLHRLKPSGSDNAIRAAGLCFAQGASNIGLLVLSSQTLLPRPGAEYSSQCAGLFGTLYRRHSTVAAELSVMSSGYALEMRGLKKSNAMDAGFTFWNYSTGYINPVGRGTSAFSSRIVELPENGDTARFVDLRSGECGNELFARFRGNHFSIRPGLSFAQSSRWRATRSLLTLQEEWSPATLLTRFSAEQSYLSRVEAGDSSSQSTFSINSETSPNPKFSFRTRLRFQTDESSANRLYGKLDVSLLPLAHLQLTAGYFATYPLAATGNLEHGVLVEEKFLLGNSGTIRLYGTLSKSGDSPFQPRTLGLSCGFTLL